MATKQFPAAAFQFTVPAELSPVTDPTAPRRMAGVAYSGQPITDHGYDCGPIAFDLATLRCATPAPILDNHNHGSTIGVLDTAVATDQLDIAGKLFTNLDDDARKIAAKADAGFPWQLSVGIYPGAVEDIASGQTIILNNREMQGPLSIFRNARVREVSFCALGADGLTSAHVFNNSTKFLSIPVIEAHPMTDTTDDKQPDPTPVEPTSEAKPDDTEQRVQEAEAKAAEAVAELAAYKAAAREKDVQALFASLGREFTAEAAKPYMNMDQATFAVVAQDLSALKPKAPAHLFSAVITDGKAEDTIPTFQDIAKRQLAQLAGKAA